MPEGALRGDRPHWGAWTPVPAHGGEDRWIIVSIGTIIVYQEFCVIISIDDW